MARSPVFAELLKQRIREHCPDALCNSVSQHVDDFEVILNREQSPEYWLLFSVGIVDHEIFIGAEYQSRPRPFWDEILDIRDPAFDEKFIRTFDRLLAKYGPQ